MLKLLVKALYDIFNKQPYLLIMYKALFISTNFGLFKGELTIGDHSVLAKNVFII